MTHKLIAVGLFSTLALVCQLQASGQGRERLSFNSGWRFIKGDPDGMTNVLGYYARNQPKTDNGVKQALLASASEAGLTAGQEDLGKDVSYTQPGFDDKGWRLLDLPHDWGIEGPFDQKLPGNTGKLPCDGTGWYRKTFSMPASDAGRRVCLDIDGAMSYSMVWCNGKFVGGWPYGYSSFRLDLTDRIKPGTDNTLVVRLNNPLDSSRWYSGAGIYRNVWLVKTEPVHVAHWGTRVTTPEVSSERAKVSIRVTLENRSAAEAKVAVATEVYELDTKGHRGGMPVLKLSALESGVKPPHSKNEFTETGTLANPKLWSPESPHLYLAVTTVSQDGKPVDVYETPFGIRTITFTAADGFHLNGKRVQLKGVCNHHDLGALGAAFNTRAAERQLEIMKEMGVNALRTSHNMPAPELMDLCDRMGILVMEETFDCWEKGKKSNDYGTLWDDWHEKDLRALIRRDANHPSVIMWCVGNEVREQGDAVKGPEIVAHLTSIAHSEDSTRPTVLGASSSQACNNGVQKGVDVMGQNYEIGGYGKFRLQNPDIPLVGSETASTISSRGEYFFQDPEQVAAQNAVAVAEATKKGKPAPKARPFEAVSNDKYQGKSDFQMSSYDLYTPGWGWIPDAEFASLKKNPHVAGEFVWTGFDYLGEPTPYNNDSSNLLNFQDAAGKAKMERELKELGKITVPSRSSYFGIVDLAGFKKDRFYLYQAHWRPDFPMAHILPHWNWPERAGQVTPVHVYTSGDEAELFLNGKSLGRKKKGPEEYRLRWNDVVYEPGELKVIAYKGGKEWATDVMKTTGPATKLALKADRAVIRADGTDLSFVTVTIADKDGLLVPRSKNQVVFTVTGPGEIVATDNGDATSFEPFQAPTRKAFNGLALVIVRAKAGQTGEIVLTASSGELAGAQVKLSAVKGL
jgi:beta-galactosidase